MERSTVLECSACGRRTVAGSPHCCPDPEPRLVHHPDEIHERFDPGGSVTDQWRYVPFFPVESADRVSLGEGGTPLVEASTIGEDLGIELSLKLEGSNPTGSTKDRGSSVLVTRARQQGRQGVACASTGNAAASVAAYAARASVPCRLFVPRSLPETKGVQPTVHGATVTAVDGSYADAFEQCAQTVYDNGWVDRSAGGSTYTVAGARTLGYELAEQADRVPDWVAVPMGNGGTIADAWEGWKTFADLDLAAGTPRVLGVQTAATSPIHDDLTETVDAGEATDRTRADSIDVTDPRRADDAMRAIRDSGGLSVTVSEEAIDAALTRLARDEGVFAEPASAATVAAVTRARETGAVGRGECVVAVVTGTGLKDAAAGRGAVDG